MFARFLALVFSRLIKELLCILLKPKKPWEYVFCVLGSTDIDVTSAEGTKSKSIAESSLRAF